METSKQGLERRLKEERRTTLGAALLLVTGIVVAAALYLWEGDAEGMVLFGAIGNFIPQVWSARLIREFRRARRWRRAITDVSDEIARQGDTIHVGEIVSEATIRTYSKTTDIEAPEIQDDYEQSFEINVMKYFNIGVNDVDRVQSQPALLPRFTSDAAYKLALDYDAYIRGLYLGSGQSGFETDGDITGKSRPRLAAKSLQKQRLVIEGVLDGGIAGNTDKATYTAACTKLAEEVFFPMQRRLLDLNWPGIGEDSGGEGGEGGGPRPYCMVNTKTYEALTWYVLQKTGGTGALSDAAVRGGLLRRIFGFEITPDPGMSNANAATNKVGKAQACIGLPMAIYSAEQIRSMEAYRPEKRFQDAVKGLSVYGGSRVDAEKIFCVVQGNGSAVGANDAD